MIPCGCHLMNCKAHLGETDCQNLATHLVEPMEGANTKYLARGQIWLCNACILALEQPE